MTREIDNGRFYLMTEEDDANHFIEKYNAYSAMGNMRRASGDVVCDICGQEYRKHPHAWPWINSLNRLCDGSLVHL